MTPKGRSNSSFIGRLFKRSSNEESSADDSHEPRPEGSGDEPIEGYDGLKEHEVVVGLRDLTQVQLEAVETYERSHEERAAVLDKLRYMRSSEPVEGYDTLDADSVAKELDGADTKKVKAIRDYERKFQGRRQVLDEAHRVLPDAPANAADTKAQDDKDARVSASMNRAPGSSQG
jgi:hypothetical protein